MMRIPTLLDGTPIDEHEMRTWVAALRSGELAQARDCTLQTRNGYCCLAVACKVLIPEELLRTNNDLMCGSYPEDQEAAPAWLKGINKDFENRDLVYMNKFSQSLSSLNDSFGYTFPMIADLLEEHYLGLLTTNEETIQ